MADGTGAQDILGLVPACWWAQLGPRVSDCRALGVLGAGAGASASVLVWGRAQVLDTQVDRTGWLWVLGS